MKTYTVVAKRWERGWELHIDGVGVTQTDRLNRAEQMARDLIEIMTGVSNAEVEIRPYISDQVDAEVSAARAATEAATRAQLDAAARTRALAAGLRDSGLKHAEIAVVLGVGPQRVSQILAA